MKDVSAVGGILGAEGVVFISFNYVKPGLILVHGVQDDLRMDKANTFHTNLFSNSPLAFSMLVSKDPTIITTMSLQPEASDGRPDVRALVLFDQ